MTGTKRTRLGANAIEARELRKTYPGDVCALDCPAASFVRE
jgi:hypothetical protein